MALKTYHFVRRYPCSLLCVALICILSLTPFFPETPLDDVAFIDKWTHLVMYGGTCCVMWWEHARHTLKERTFNFQFSIFNFPLATFLFLVALGGLMELLQAYCTTTRSGEWLDFWADSVGALLGTLIGLAYYRYYSRQGRNDNGKATMLIALLVGIHLSTVPAGAQSIIRRVDNMLTRNYNKGNIDTAYITRPQTKWTITARMNVSGAQIETEGKENGHHFKSEMEANRKATLSLGVSYLGVSLSASLNPSQLLGKYHDYELNFNSYGRRFGFDVIYQDAKNFKGWYDQDGLPRYTLPDGMLSVKTLNVNAFYVFNSRRFSYPAAFSQSYIQRRSAGSFLLAASAMGQKASLDWDEGITLKMTNIGLGAGYGYNYVPGRGWLLHISALPTFIVYSNTSLTHGDTRMPLNYHFPEVIITGRGAAVYQWRNKFVGLSMVFNFTNIGNEKDLAVNNIKWRVRTFFGVRL